MHCSLASRMVLLASSSHDMGSQIQASRASRPLRGLHCGPRLETNPDLHTPTPEARFHPSLSMEPWGNVARLHTAEARFQLIGRLQMRQSYLYRALGLRLCSLIAAWDS